MSALIDQLSQNNSNDEFNIEKYKFLTSLSAAEIANFISFFQKTDGFIMFKYQIYSFTQLTNQLKLTIPYPVSDKDAGFPIVYIQSQEFTAYLPPKDALQDWLKGQLSINGESFSFWLVNLGYLSNENSALHATLLIFDNKERLIYYFDPNGKLLDYNVNFMDRLWTTYFSDLSTPYFYVPTTNWRNKISLNYHVESVFDMGNCLSWCFLIISMINDEKKNPKEVYDTLALLTNHERSVMIYQFNNKLFNILQGTFA